MKNRYPRSRFSLVWNERKLLLTVTLLLLSLKLGLAVLPYRRVIRLLDFTAFKRKDQDSGNGYRGRVIWAVQAIGKRTLGDRPCLPQALATQWLLRLNGEHADLHIGVRKGADQVLAAHAWLEQEGQVIIGGQGSPVQYKSMNAVQS